jgi:8-oxo-dGTP diphosphatase
MPDRAQPKQSRRKSREPHLVSVTPPHASDNEIVNSISVDNIILGLDQGQLKVLLVRQNDPRHHGLWALPGGWIRHDEDLRNAAIRLLADLTGLRGIFLEQLKTFGRVDRLPFERVITVAYYALVNTDQYLLVAGQSTLGVEWRPVNDIPELVYDHAEILAWSHQYLKRAIRYTPIAFELLPQKFTLNQLQTVYQAVLGRKFDKPNFRRKILKHKFVKPCQEFRKASRQRAAQLYYFDAQLYEELAETRFTWMA